MTCPVLGRVPRTLRENLLWRELVLQASAASDARGAIREACRRDILFWINTFVWQYNPQHRGDEVGPFVTWPFQDEALLEMVRAVEEGDPLLLEKSREMGASWMCLLVFLWYFLFHPWKKFLVISRNADAVDRDDPDALFWKLDFILRHLPDWLRPRIERKAMVFKNRDNHSSITGQASTGKAGVGGRATAMFLDEFAQIDEAQEVFDRTADTTRCRIFNSTHTGVGTVFHRLCDSGIVKKLRLHWSQHPEKNRGLYQYDEDAHQLRLIDDTFEHDPDYEFVLDGKLRSPWYDETCKSRTPRAIACDLDIDAKGAASQFFDAGKIRQLVLHNCRKPDWVADVCHDGEGGSPELRESLAGSLQLWIRKDPHGRLPRGKYVIGGDIATGSGATPTCFSVADARTGEKVAAWANPDASQDQAAGVAVALARIFKGNRDEEAAIAWEANGPGARFGKKVLEFGAQNVFWRQSQPDSINPKPTRTPGFVSNPKQKVNLLSAYREALYSRHFVNPDVAAMEECLSYEYTQKGTVEHGGAMRSPDPSGARENHGDRVSADALCWMLVDQHGFVGARPSELPPEDVPVLSLAWRRALRQHDARVTSRESLAGVYRGRRR